MRAHGSVADERSSKFRLESSESSHLLQQLIICHYSHMTRKVIPDPSQLKGITGWSRVSSNNNSYCRSVGLESIAILHGLTVQWVIEVGSVLTNLSNGVGHVRCCV
jgi:hypothetical protein